MILLRSSFQTGKFKDSNSAFLLAKEVGTGILMLSFPDCSNDETEKVNGHDLTSVTVNAALVDVAKDQLSAVVPYHYVAPDRLANILRNLGKPAVAELVESLLPNNSSSKSGDLGEIVATEYIEETSQYTVPIRRLRWKDHRDMAMRGEDAIGVMIPGKTRPIDFLKVEVKSRATLQTSVVKDARKALDAFDGLPTQHALQFVAARAYESGNEQVADAIVRASLVDGIFPHQVEHMLFVFTGNNPKEFLKKDLEGYAGSISQKSVGFRVENHQQFIADVFEGALDENES